MVANDFERADRLGSTNSMPEISKENENNGESKRLVEMSTLEKTKSLK